MTCRERLEIEHPDKIDADSLGGCIGCPRNYGYNDNHVSNCSRGKIISHEVCSKCWDQEYVGSVRSFVLFKDGHEEDIVFHQARNDKVLFATRSGMYFAEGDANASRPMGLTFYRFHIPEDPNIISELNTVDTIDHIILNNKVRREYCIDLKVGPHIHGSLVVSRDISDEACREMCIQDAIKNVTFKDV